jgi:hypothetical protein
MPRIRVTRLAIPLGMKPERVQENDCHKIVMLIGSERLKTVPLPLKSRLVNRLTQRLQERAQINSAPPQQFFDNIVVDSFIRPMY